MVFRQWGRQRMADTSRLSAAGGRKRTPFVGADDPAVKFVAEPSCKLSPETNDMRPSLKSFCLLARSRIDSLGSGVCVHASYSRASHARAGQAHPHAL